MSKGQIKLSKSMSLLGLIIGLFFLIIGFTIAIPNADKFGIFLTFLALLFILFYAYNLFSQGGITLFNLDLKHRDSAAGEVEDFDRKLRKLNKLKEDGLITEEEFNLKRQEIMQKKW